MEKSCLLMALQSGPPRPRFWPVQCWVTARPLLRRGSLGGCILQSGRILCPHTAEGRGQEGPSSLHQAFVVVLIHRDTEPSGPKHVLIWSHKVSTWIFRRANQVMAITEVEFRNSSKTTSVLYMESSFAWITFEFVFLLQFISKP